MAMERELPLALVLLTGVDGAKALAVAAKAAKMAAAFMVLWSIEGDENEMEENNDTNWESGRYNTATMMIHQNICGGA